MPQSLTPREARFVAEYTQLRNAKQAALNAGYSPKSAAVLGPRALRKPHIAAALAAAGVEVTLGASPPGQIRRPASRLRHGLTQRQRRFVAEYLVCGNYAEAARRIGCGSRNAQSNGFRLARVPAVAAAIAAEQAASAARTGITTDRVRREFARIAFAEIGSIADWGENGLALLPRDDIAPDDRAAIAELRLKPGKHGMKATIRLHSKHAALVALAKHLGMYEKGAAGPSPAEKEAADRDAKAELRARLQRIMKGEG